MSRILTLQNMNPIALRKVLNLSGCCGQISKLGALGERISFIEVLLFCSVSRALISLNTGKQILLSCPF